MSLKFLCKGGRTEVSQLREEEIKIRMGIYRWINGWNDGGRREREREGERFSLPFCSSCTCKGLDVFNTYPTYCTDSHVNPFCKHAYRHTTNSQAFPTPHALLGAFDLMPSIYHFTCYSHTVAFGGLKTLRCDPAARHGYTPLPDFLKAQMDDHCPLFFCNSAVQYAYIAFLKSKRKKLSI